MLHTIVTVVLAIPAFLMLLVVAGQFIPILGASLVGVTLSVIAARVALVALAYTAVTLIPFALAPSVGGAVVVGAAALAAVLATVNTIRQLLVARRHDVRVDLGASIRAAKPESAPDHDVVYTSYEGEDVALSLWKPVGAHGHAPVMVLVPGGGWFQGSRLDNEVTWHARWFADRGYLVATVDYSHSSYERHLWDVEEFQLADAIRWVARHAVVYGGDPDRMVLSGGSAGGNLSLNVVDHPDMPPIRALSVLYPPTDVREIYDSPDLLLGKWVRSMGVRYTGGTPEEYPERYAAVDCNTHIRADMPPVLISYGTRDHLVPARTITPYVERLRVVGVETKTIAMPHSGHGFDIEASIGCQIWRDVTLRWFRDHGA